MGRGASWDLKERSQFAPADECREHEIAQIYCHARTGCNRGLQRSKPNQIARGRVACENAGLDNPR